MSYYTPYKLNDIYTNIWQMHAQLYWRRYLHGHVRTDTHPNIYTSYCNPKKDLLRTNYLSKLKSCYISKIIFILEIILSNEWIKNKMFISGHINSNIVFYVSLAYRQFHQASTWFSWISFNSLPYNYNSLWKSVLKQKE